MEKIACGRVVIPGNRDKEKAERKRGGGNGCLTGGGSNAGGSSTEDERVIRHIKKVNRKTF